MSSFNASSLGSVSDEAMDCFHSACTNTACAASSWFAMLAVSATRWLAHRATTGAAAPSANPVQRAVIEGNCLQDGVKEHRRRVGPHDAPLNIRQQPGCRSETLASRAELDSQ